MTKQELLDFVNSIDENDFIEFVRDREVRFCDHDLSGKARSVYKGPWITMITIKGCTSSHEFIENAVR